MTDVTSLSIMRKVRAAERERDRLRTLLDDLRAIVAESDAVDADERRKGRKTMRTSVLLLVLAMRLLVNRPECRLECTCPPDLEPPVAITQRGEQCAPRLVAKAWEKCRAWCALPPCDEGGDYTDEGLGLA